jgi:WD40 repeat protein
MSAEYKFWAFISYSHIDKKWGDWLHRNLETYKVPKPLVGRETQRGEPVPARVNPIFRDREELPTSADLGSVITEALKQSRYLVVICSPHSAKSHWVNKEILDYKKLGRENHILSLIVDGVPNAADGKPGIPVEAECFPDALKYQLGEDGEINKTRRTEPIAADARQQGDGRLNAKLKLLAGILGVNYDDLKRRDEQRRRRRQYLLFTISTALILVFAALAGIALWQWQQAELQKHRVQTVLSRADCTTALDRISKNEDAEAIARLCRALDMDPDNHDADALLFSLLSTRNWLLPLDNLQLDDEQLLALDANGHKAMSLKDGTLRFWDIDAHQVIRNIPGYAFALPPPVFTPDGQSAIIDVSNQFERLNLATGASTLLQTNDQKDWTDPNFYLTPKGWTTAIYSVKSNQIISTLDYHEPELPAFSPNGQRLAAVTIPDNPDTSTANLFNTLRLWNVSNGARLSFKKSYPDAIAANSWSVDSRFLLAASQNILDIWNPDVARLKAEPPCLADNVLDAWFTPDGKRIIAVTGNTAGEDLSSDQQGMYMYAFNPMGPDKESFSHATAAFIWSADPDTSAVSAWRQPPWVLDAEFSPDNRWIVTTSGNSAQIWNAVTHELKSSIQMDDVPVTAVFSPDSRRLLLVSASETAQIWDVPGNRAVGQPIINQEELDYAQNHNERSVTSIGFAPVKHPNRAFYGAFSPDGKRFALAIGFGVHFFDANTDLDITKQPMRGNDFVQSVCFSSDSKELLTASLDSVGHLWDVATGSPIGQPMNAKQFAAFNPNSDYIVTLADSAVQIWDATNQQCLWSIQLNEKNNSAEFSPDSKRIVIASGNNSRVWNWRTARAAPVVMTHDSPVTSAVFSPDGNYVLTASEDKTAKVWDAATGQQVSVPMMHTATVNVASFNSTGTAIVTADDDGAVKVWPFDPASLPSWTGDLAKSLAECDLDSAGNPIHFPPRTMNWLRQQIQQETNNSDPMVVWARGILAVSDGKSP